NFDADVHPTLGERLFVAQMMSERPDRQVALQVRMLTESALNDARFDGVESLTPQVITDEHPLSFGPLLQFREVGEIHRAEANHRDSAGVGARQIFPG